MTVMLAMWSADQAPRFGENDRIASEPVLIALNAISSRNTTLPALAGVREDVRTANRKRPGSAQGLPPEGLLMIAWAHYGARSSLGSTTAAGEMTKLRLRRKQMGPLTVILTGLTGTLATVVAYFWPQLMTWTREHLLPWVDRYAPDLAAAVRLAFHDLDKIGVGWRRVVRTAWQNLRNVLVSQSATFIQAPNGDWEVQITSSVRNLAEEDKPIITIATEQRLAWEHLPDEVRAHALSNGLDGTSIDILHARDLLLADIL